MDQKQILANKLTATEAAQFLGTSISFIRKSTQNGSLVYYRLGNRFYYLESDLLSLIKKITPPDNGEFDLE